MDHQREQAFIQALVRIPDIYIAADSTVLGAFADFLQESGCEAFADVLRGTDT